MNKSHKCKMVKQNAVMLLRGELKFSQIILEILKLKHTGCPKKRPTVVFAHPNPEEVTDCYPGVQISRTSINCSQFCFELLYHIIMKYGVYWIGYNMTFIKVVWTLKIVTCFHSQDFNQKLIKQCKQIFCNSGKILTTFP